MIQRTDALEDLAFIVCTAMHQSGTTAVLSGGRAATLYAPVAYQSRDLDFVLSFAVATSSPLALLELGFRITPSQGIYGHPETEYTVEFIEGPIAVGEEVIQAWSTWQRGEQVLHLLTPTDCVRDRLAAAIRDDDLDLVQQAAEVAMRHPVDMDLIQSWCEREGGARTYALFRHLILV